MSEWQLLILVLVIFFWNYYLFHRLRMAEGYIARLQEEVVLLLTYSEMNEAWKQRWSSEHAPR